MMEQKIGEIKKQLSNSIPEGGIRDKEIGEIKEIIKFYFSLSFC